MTVKVPMTHKGAEKLKEELQHLKSIQRPAVVQAIAEARAHGDLKENAEYHAAKERQGFIEARIRDIEHKLSHAVVINVSTVAAQNKVIFGATVKIVNTDTEEEVLYQIVGEDEADIKSGKISVHSPIARALIGKEMGDVTLVQTPGGNTEYEIIEILFVE
ncbi:MAG: transcription elongation factor GreA [Gammaproteobacteria bacterium]|nr:transcription elongation factor GreA [Gammaproteobacteria bacterium]